MDFVGVWGWDHVGYLGFEALANPSCLNPGARSLAKTSAKPQNTYEDHPKNASSGVQGLQHQLRREGPGEVRTDGVS